MRKLSIYCVVLVLLSFAASGLAEESTNRDSSVVGRKFEDFTLQDWRGKTWSLQEIRATPLNDEQVEQVEQEAQQPAKTTVVAFLGVECPLVKLYASRLAKMAEQYSAQGVAFVGVDSNQQDSLTEIGHFVRVQKIPFPMLKDPGNKVADQFGAKRTPEVFVLDAEGIVRYHGRIDDQYTYGIQKFKSKRNYLADALDSLLAGKEISLAETESVGCHIGRVLVSQEESEVTYSRQISRIFQKHCVQCHREGEVAPFALTDYDEVVGWAEMIVEVVEQQRMPPWHADPQHGEFANDSRLSDKEKQLIYDWVAAGAPQGDENELPPPRKFVEGWQIGEPDQVFYMREEPFMVSAKGEVRYQYYMVDPKFTEDKWVKAAECRPGSPAVVHHIIVGVRPSGRHDNRVHGLRSQWLTATAPGAKPLILPDGYAKKIPAGSKLIFQMHYTPNGVSQPDRSYVGLIFADPKEVKKQVVTQQAGTNKFEIPPGADNHLVESRYRFRHDSLVLALFPHMHLRGKAFKYLVEYPGGKKETLLNVPQYDFNWQNAYKFTEPKRIPAGSVLHCEARFDNSEKNLANPDPTVPVRWGDQTWEEMMIGYFDLAIADQDLTKEPAVEKSPRTKKFLQSIDEGELKPDEAVVGEIRQLASSALNNGQALNELWERLRKIAPQLDRVCWSTVSDGKLTIRLAAQDASLRKSVGGEGLSIDAKGKALTHCSQHHETVVYPFLAVEPSVDLRYMSRRFASSMHVPIVLRDKTKQDERIVGSLNFWSAEQEAFPTELVQILEKTAQAATAPQAD